jgi:Trypsin-like peptidase domain
VRALCLLCLLSGCVSASEHAFIQYFPDTQTLHAWREKNASIELDFPEQRALDTVEASDFRRRLARIHQINAQQLGDYQEERVEFGNDRVLLFRNAPPVLTQSRTELCKQAEYTANRVRFAGDRTPDFVGRLEPVQCAKGVVMAGSGTAWLFAPQWSLTAAHVVNTQSGPQPCRYRIVPGARAFADAQSRPLGVLAAHYFAQANPPQDYVEEIDALANDALENYINSDWALLRHDHAGSQIAIWPLLVFANEKLSDRDVIKTGFPRGYTTRPLRKPGGSLSAQGLSICSGESSPEIFALQTDSGDSGAPIWTIPAKQADNLLRVVSLLSISEQGQIPRAQGPKFSLAIYRQLLALLLQSQRAEGS